MRTTWNGALSFGLVTIPVGLAPATKPAARQSDISFRLLHRECRTPIKQQRFCPTHERVVDADEIVRGWEVAKGEFVLVEDADLEAIEGIEVRDPELDLARQLVDSLVGEFDPSELTSDYRRDLRALLEAKLEGAEIARPEPVVETPVIDLMDALRRSVAEAKERKPAAQGGRSKAAAGNGRRRAPARSKR